MCYRPHTPAEFSYGAYPELSFSFLVADALVTAAIRSLLMA